MSNVCECVWVGDYDHAAFYCAEKRGAIKIHKCDECQRDILPGETYERVRGKWDGQIDTFKTCSDCLSVRESFFCEGYLHGGLWEFMWEHLSAVDGEVKSSCLETLTPVAMAKVIDRIDEIWSDHD